MNFLGIDTSGNYLSVVVYRSGELTERYLAQCERKHSIVLMDEIQAALARAKLQPSECDFFAAVTGPGSFTGIRIGISTVKGLCFACDKKALAITSFDCLAYAKKGGRTLALIDAGHDCYYAAGYDNLNESISPRYCTKKEIDAFLNEGYVPITCNDVNPCKGLTQAILTKCGTLSSPEELVATYLRKSSAEENRT